MSARTTRTARTRVLAAAAITIATLTLSACNSGEGVRDEGASSPASSSPADSTTPTGKPREGSAAGGQTDSAGSSSNGSTGSGGTGGTGGSGGSTGSTGSGGSTGSTAGDNASATRVPCSGSNTRTTATEVTRPLNHLLLTVTNTGSKNCDLTGYPAVRFGEAQSVPPAFEDSKPQAVVTLAPGESGYASVLLASADGSGIHGYTAKSLAVVFDKGANSHPSLPAKGVYVDSSVSVSYWQASMADALAY
ncbi:DUF4232 domain-containing protein [Streptomyces sp. 2A115]|uniref:DUF4232 domain-containing protein n=1 Tax=Streptomyces sp. 2A115 TaxID=3457439 RepID=UPI003FD072EB